MTINIDEKFMAVGIKSVDVKHRINLGEKIMKLVSKKKAEAYKVFIGQDGDILLRPVVTVPAKEAWIYENKEVMTKIRQGLVEAGEGKIEKVKDVEEFFEKL